MPSDIATASPQSAQNSPIMHRSSHLPTPAMPTPYWLTFIMMMPKLTIEAGMKRDSVGCTNEARKVRGYK
jgi:hypothetical protein